MASLPVNSVELNDQSVEDTDQRQLIADIAEALRLARLSDKSAAIVMGVDKGQFSRFLSNQGGVDARRLARLGDDFWREFVKLRAPRYAIQVREQSRRADAIADVLMATAMALRESDFSDDRLPKRAGPPIKATLDDQQEQTRRTA